MLVIMKKGRLSLKIERKKTVMYSARLVDTGWMLHVRPGISYISLIQNSFVHRRGKEGPGWVFRQMHFENIFVITSKISSQANKNVSGSEIEK